MGECIYIDLCFLDLGTIWGWVVSMTPLLLTPRERAPATHQIGGSVDHRGGLDNMEKLFLTVLGLELRLLCYSAHSQSLYRQCYCVSSNRLVLKLISPTFLGKGPITKFSQSQWTHREMKYVVTVNLFKGNFIFPLENVACPGGNMLLC
jgi:hypothetical protein